jgi:hypothetical protein
MKSGSAFVGRAAELALLAEQAAAAGRGEGRAVLIGGEPGIGKTRLAGEAAARGRRGHAVGAVPGGAGRGLPAVLDVRPGRPRTRRDT